MKDPWRIVDPLKPPAPSRIDLTDHDFDADLRPSMSCVLRFKACAIEVLSKDIQTPRDALEVLARCIFDLKKAEFRRTAIVTDVYAKYGSVRWDVPPSDLPCARLECEDVTIWFANETLDRGALRLVRALIQVSRDPKLSSYLKKHGITPMLKA